MDDHIDYGWEDDNGTAWYAQEMIEQEQWEKKNNVKALLDNDPDYHKWSDELDRLAEEDREIMDLAAIEDERNFNGLSAWD